MELVEKYLYAIGKKLPRKQKRDIVEELRSLIIDNLEDRVKEGEPTDEDISQILIEMGSPAEVAKKYCTGTQWLIGPQLYDMYLMMCKIVLGALLLGYSVSIVVSLFSSLSGSGFGQIMWYIAKNLLSIIPGILAAIGAVTLIFAIIERTSKKPLDIDFAEGGKWNPSKLEPIPKKEEVVKPIESILGIVFTVFVLVLFYFYRDKIGFYYMSSLGDNWVMVKIFSQSALRTYLPLWTISWVLSLGMYIWLLCIGKYNMLARVFEMIVSALNIGILFFMANGPHLFEFDKLGADFIDLQPAVDFLTNNQSTIFYILAVLSIFGLLANLGKLIVGKVKGRI
ncbi:MAG: hypothetical protein KAQ68_08300 [Clostridiales bacterium]|nr:hypothetical protein [Clostridiales bacterium]